MIGNRRRVLRALFAMLGVVVVVILLSRLTSTDDSKDGRHATLVPPSRLTEDFLAGGRTAVISQEVLHDAALAASRIVVQNKVHGYVLAAGSSIQIHAPIANDLWAVGNLLEINASIGDNLWLAGRLVRLRSQTQVQGDANIVADTAELAGPIVGSLQLTARRATLAGSVGGTVSANVDHLQLAAGAVVEGNLIVSGANPPEIHPTAHVRGMIYHRRTKGGWLLVPLLQRWLFAFSALVIVASVSYFFEDTWTNGTRTRLAKQPVKTLGTGLLALGVLLLLIICLAATVVGWVLALGLLGLFMTGAVLSLVRITLVIGDSFGRRWPLSRLRRIIVGALVLSLFFSLPTIGILIQLLVVALGLGSLILDRLSKMA